MPFAALASVFASSEYRTVRSLLVIVVMWVAFLCGSGCQLPVRGWTLAISAPALGELGVAVGVAGQAPSAVGGFSEQGPGAAGQRGIPAAAATMAVSWLITGSCLSRSRAPALVRT